jgi:hypothetical protein
MTRKGDFSRKTKRAAIARQANRGDFRVVSLQTLWVDDELNGIDHERIFCITASSAEIKRLGLQEALDFLPKGGMVLAFSGAGT